MLPQGFQCYFLQKQSGAPESCLQYEFNGEEIILWRRIPLREIKLPYIFLTPAHLHSPKAVLDTIVFDSTK